MSNFGVLVVECEGSYQIVAEVCSLSEAYETAANYASLATPENGCLPPEAFVVKMRDSRGWFTRTVSLDDSLVSEAQVLLGQISRLQRSLRRSWSQPVQATLDAHNSALASLGGAR